MPDHSVCDIWIVVKLKSILLQKGFPHFNVSELLQYAPIKILIRDSILWSWFMVMNWKRIIWSQWKQFTHLSSTVNTWFACTCCSCINTEQTHRFIGWFKKGNHQEMTHTSKHQRNVNPPRLPNQIFKHFPFWRYTHI